MQQLQLDRVRDRDDAAAARGGDRFDHGRIQHDVLDRREDRLVGRGDRDLEGFA
jgi:hypothetical protein